MKFAHIIIAAAWWIIAIGNLIAAYATMAGWDADPKSVQLAAFTAFAAIAISKVTP